jgi:hypothetical protein
MTRLLLCVVFKPFGVKDETAEPLCTIELLNNQVTREQEIHLPRSNNPSFALYLMAQTAADFNFLAAQSLWQAGYGCRTGSSDSFCVAESWRECVGVETGSLLTD